MKTARWLLARNDYPPRGNRDRGWEERPPPLRWPSPVRDVDRLVGDEGRRIGRQRRRGSHLKPKETLLLLDLLSGDEPGARLNTQCENTVFHNFVFFPLKAIRPLDWLLWLNTNSLRSPPPGRNKQREVFHFIPSNWQRHFIQSRTFPLCSFQPAAH